MSAVDRPKETVWIIATRHTKGLSGIKERNVTSLKSTRGHGEEKGYTVCYTEDFIICSFRTIVVVIADIFPFMFMCVNLLQ